MNKFAERLYELRTGMGLTRKQFAEKCQTLERNISYWELGQRECNFDMLIKIAAVLDTTRITFSESAIIIEGTGAY